MSPEDACQQLGVCRGKTKDDLDALTDGIDKAADFADTVAVTGVETLLDPTTLNPGAKAMKMVGKGVGKILGHTDEMRGATRGDDAARGAAEMRHLLPRASRFGKLFERAGLNIEDFKIPLDKATHRLNPGGIHTKAGGDWNGVWDSFFEGNPSATRQEILDQVARMRSDFGI